MRVHALAPVVAVDLDGTSGDYHGHFTWFLNTIYYPNRSKPFKPNWDPRFRGEFSSALCMDKTSYRDAKLAYRQGGLKRCMPTFPGDYLREHVQYIRNLDIQVWVTTNRPWMRLDNIDKDTKYWIDQNMGEVDGVIFSQEKYHDLIDNVGQDRVLGVFDDLPEVIQEADRLGLRSAIRLGDHNRHWDSKPGNTRAMNNFKDFTHLVDEWREEWDSL